MRALRADVDERDRRQKRGVRACRFATCHAARCCLDTCRIFWVQKRVPVAGEVEEGTEGESVARTLGFQR